ncbi:MAG: hypothetical protein HY517_04680, partial [Candidatus Aenigmarchaeota archaeon]|nr:hypothetical protein [Candidatus Aenigmarchaeota archaeon]
MMTDADYFEDPRLQEMIDRSEAAVFDVNGFMINDEPFHLAAVNSVITPLGIPEVPASYWKTECVGLRLADTLP